MASKRLVAILGAAGLVVGALALPGTAGAAVAGLVRVDQVGYLPGEAKQAYLMVPGAVGGATFAVVNSSGTKVLTGQVGASRGGWNDKYKAVYPINAMGISKAMMEKLMVAKSRMRGPGETVICATRYGNVMASRGSVQRQSTGCDGRAKASTPTSRNDRTLR